MIKDPQLKKGLIQEVNTMASLEHTNIVKLFKTFEGIHHLIQKETGTSSSWSIAIWAIFTIFRANFQPKYSLWTKPSISSTRYWEECKSYIKIKSFIETSSYRIFSSGRPTKTDFSVKLGISGWQGLWRWLQIPTAALKTIWPHKYSNQSLMTKL